MLFPLPVFFSIIVVAVVIIIRCCSFVAIAVCCRRYRQRLLPTPAGGGREERPARNGRVQLFLPAIVWVSLFPPPPRPAPPTGTPTTYFRPSASLSSGGAAAYSLRPRHAARQSRHFPFVALSSLALRTACATSVMCFLKEQTKRIEIKTITALRKVQYEINI